MALKLVKNEDDFVRELPQCKNLMEIINQLCVKVNPICKKDGIVKLFKNNDINSFIGSLAAYLVEHPKQFFSDEPIQTWTGKNIKGNPCIREGQICPKTGNPRKGGFFKETGKDWALEHFSTDGSFTSGWRRYGFSMVQAIIEWGPVMNGFNHGQTCCRYGSGGCYEGELKNNSRNGFGTYRSGSFFGKVTVKEGWWNDEKFEKDRLTIYF